jgi:hypothetical protein
MPKDPSKLSLSDLEKLIDDRQTHLETLVRKREQLVADLEGYDLQIQEFMKTGRISQRTGRKRARNEQPLRAVMMEILGRNKKGLSLQNLTQQIKDTGYKSHSLNFQNVVYQCLYNTPEVIHDSATGLYRIKR